MRKLFSVIPEKGKIINKIHIIGNKERNYKTFILH